MTPGLCGWTPASDSTDRAGAIEMGRSVALVPVSTTGSETSWLVAEPVVERIQLDETSWVDVVRGLLPSAEADTVHDELVATVPWEQGQVFRYERWVEMPRLEGYQSGSYSKP